MGDDRESLLRAFKLAGERADAVIVNGGLGPTVDDLSQEIAAQAAGCELVLCEEWLTRMEDFFRRRSRDHAAQQPQAGDAAEHGRDDRQPRRHRLRLRARHRPRPLLLHAGRAARAAPHAGGAGHSPAARAQRAADRDLPQALPLLRPRRVARRLAADRRGRARARRQREARLPRALPAAGDEADRARHRHGRRPRKLAPVEREVRKRLGNFILAEDDQTLEGVVLRRAGRPAAARWPSWRRSPAARSRRASAICPGAEKVFRRGIVARDLAEVCAAVGLTARPAGELTRETAEAVAAAARKATGATHALAVLIDLDEGADRIEFGGAICLAIATAGRASPRGAAASWAAASGCGWARSRWAWTACAASARVARGRTDRLREGLRAPTALKNALVLLLTAAAGYVDAVSYLALGRVFTANMTGNTVLLGLALVQRDRRRRPLGAGPGRVPGRRRDRRLDRLPGDRTRRVGRAG